ncbi:MAG: hypothetical protein IMY75_09980 [Chloroflexi bacterium]|nr:hypothetical protein [Chloroflexota bacterium]
MSKDTWLKLKTAIILSAKVAKLPSNDHRWAFIVFMILEKKGLTDTPRLLTNGFFFVSTRRLRRIEKDLVSAGLINEDRSVIDFEESQLTPAAYRMRRHRERNKLRNSDVTSDGDSRMQNAECREDKKEKTKKKPARNEEVEEGCRVLCEVGNRAIGTDRGPTGPMRTTVKAILKAGFSADDIRTVAEHRAKEDWFDKSNVLESLVRIGTFESYLQVAKESGQAKAVKTFTRKELGI